MLHNINKGLATEARNGEHGYSRGGNCAPDHVGLHELRVAHISGAEYGLGQNALKAVIHLGGDKVDVRVLDKLAAIFEDIDRETAFHLGCALRRDIDVRLKIAALVHRCERYSWRYVIAYMNRNVAHQAVKRRADL